MTPLAEEKEFHFKPWQLWVFRIALYSLPAFLLSVAFYCVWHRIPNPRSIVPKSVILLMGGIALGLMCNRVDRMMGRKKASYKDKRMAAIGVPIVALILWLAMFAFRNNSEFNFTGSGDPFFATLWLIFSTMMWALDRDGLGVKNVVKP